LVGSEIYFLCERVELDHTQFSLSAILSFHSIVNIRDYNARKPSRFASLRLYIYGKYIRVVIWELTNLKRWIWK
jgi:hypothetical protein